MKMKIVLLTSHEEEKRRKKIKRKIYFEHKKRNEYDASYAEEERERMREQIEMLSYDDFFSLQPVLKASGQESVQR